MSNLSPRDWLKLHPRDSHRAAYCSARNSWRLNLPNSHPQCSLDHEAWEIGMRHEERAENFDFQSVYN